MSWKFSSLSAIEKGCSSFAGQISGVGVVVRRLEAKLARGNKVSYT